MDNQPTEQQKPTKKVQTKAEKKAANIVVAVIFLVIIGLIAWFISSVYGHKSQIKASVDTSQFNVVSSSKLGVTFHVTNNGKSAATPTCQLQVTDPNTGDSGTDGFTMDKINPGQTVTSADTLTITGNDASGISQGTITCS